MNREIYSTPQHLSDESYCVSSDTPLFDSVKSICTDPVQFGEERQRVIKIIDWLDRGMRNSSEQDNPEVFEAFNQADRHLRRLNQFGIERGWLSDDFADDPHEVATS